MKEYKCFECGGTFSLETIDGGFVCPKCGYINKSNEESTSEIDAIIESVLEEELSIKSNKILNLKDEKYLIISDNNKVIYKKDEKCINCGQCKKVCENQVNISYDLSKCEYPICIGCGQCVKNCPSKALNFRENYKDIKQIIDANEKIVIAIVEPLVDIALYKAFNIEYNDNSSLKMVGLLKKIGFDYVFNSGFANDLCIIEEVSEFANRLKAKDTLPYITSSCPSFVNYLEIYHPELIQNLSTLKNPSEIQIELIKNYFCQTKGFDPSKIVCVNITPCSALKNNDDCYSMGVNELIELVKEEEINISQVTEKEYDELLSECSSSSNLFNVVGGHCESFVKAFYKVLTKNNIKEDDFSIKDIRNTDGINEAIIDIGDYKLRVAIVEEMANFENLLLNDKYKKYHYIEVMNCKGGCISGSTLYTIDYSINDFKDKLYQKCRKCKVKNVNDNKEIKKLYNKYLSTPLSDKSKELLHRNYSDFSYLLYK